MTIIALFIGIAVGYFFHDDIKKWHDTHFNHDGGGPLGA